MTESSDYCTAALLEARLMDGASWTAAQIAVLSNIITAVSRWIDNYTGTHFYTSASDETRYYTALDRSTLYPDDDIISITTLATDNAGARTYGEEWEATDFDCLPYNYSVLGQPIRTIERTPLGSYSFPLERKAVKIIGKFGYCTTANLPKMVNEACLLQCERIFKRKDAPFGIVSNPMGEMRLITKLDPDVQQMLDVYRRFV